MRFTPQDEEFRADVRGWLAANLTGEFAACAARAARDASTRRHAERLAWNRHLAAAGWTCLGWPAEHGGRGATLAQQVIFYEEYARSGRARPGLDRGRGTARADPDRVRHAGAAAAVPAADRGPSEELWCQGYSEPGAGSDLASVATTRGAGRRRVGDHRPEGVDVAGPRGRLVLRAGPDRAGSRRGAGLSYLLVPMRQPGVTVRPIRQLTGTAEFNEVFFDGARTARGQRGRRARRRLADREGDAGHRARRRHARPAGRVPPGARRADRSWPGATEAAADPLLRDRLARAWIGLEVIRAYALDTLGGRRAPAEASVLKVLWSRWHQDLGELAMDVLGAPLGHHRGANPTTWTTWQRLFLFSRADTIYGGSDEIQRNIIASRALGLPRGAAR